MLEGLIEKTWKQKQLEAYSYLLDAILDGDIKILIKRVGIENVVEWLQNGRYKIEKRGGVKSNE